jgi:hypothetical protein
VHGGVLWGKALDVLGPVGLAYKLDIDGAGIVIRWIGTDPDDVMLWHHVLCLVWPFNQLNGVMSKHTVIKADFGKLL